jgi:hypothetical protein
MNNIKKQYYKITKYGRLYSRIEKNHYVITFHNIDHRTEPELQKSIYPSINLLQSECLTNRKLINAAKANLTFESAINQTNDMAVIN